ncbi:hypothetical protein QZH41_016915 [Actinostola sp. cb2023]|nr:hypothetical protein QZH41_016915 [Actinostola sp. cb2023]
MAIKCQHQQHDDPDNQTKAKKSLLEEEKPKESSMIGANAEERFELHHVKNDWFEKGKDLLTIHVYIKELKKDFLDVSLCEDEFNVQFATKDDKFLNMYQGTSENTLFNWNVKLRGKINVASSSFKILKFMIEINLKKQTAVRWGSLQKPHLPGVFTVLYCVVPTLICTGGEYKDDLNADNPLSFGGKLAVVFANLMKHMWSGKSRHVAPHQLKTLVGEKVCQFRGFMQQDAQEFMAFLLDGLHEDLNRITKKPYTEEVEGAGRPDHVVAEEAWSRYKSRNDSVVVDLFQGQLKSKLTCPVCRKISIKFDPFMNLSVPLPKEQKLLNIVVFFKDPSKTPVKVTVKVCQDADLEQLTTAVEGKTGVREDNMRVVEEFQGKFHKFFDKGSSLTNVVSTDNIFVFEVLSLEEAGEEVYEVPIMQRLLYPLNIPLHCADCYKNQDTSEPLKRCVGCYAIGYCNRKCQERHWAMHKKYCKKSGKHAIGKPFIVSMPASQATFTRLKDLAEVYAK